MKSYHIEGSSESPEVLIDKESGIFDISGVSTFRYPAMFYKNLAKWINVFNTGTSKTNNVNIKLTKINEPSVKGIRLVLNQLEEKVEINENPVINWYCSEENKWIRNIGEKIKATVGLPFNIIPA